MTNKEMAQELDELMTRFKRLKKALDEEQYERLSPAQQAIAEAARQFKGDLRKADKATLLKKAQEIGEQQQAQRLANQLQRAGILGSSPRVQLQPSGADQETWLKNNGFQTEQQLAKQESEWGNGINNWLAEATKPLNQRFKSEEEERAYWDRIKVSDNGSGNSGY